MRNRPLRSLAIVIAACTALLAALGAGSATAERRASACSASSLVVWLPNGKGSGAAGSVYYNLSVTNSGSTACTLKGYPKVTAVTPSGRHLGPQAAHEKTGNPVKTQTIAPDGSAKITVRVTEAGNYSPSECHPRPAGGLAVVLPGTSTARIVPLPFDGCAALDESLLGTTAVLK